MFVTDIMGRQVLSQKVIVNDERIEIDLHTLTSGMYVLHLVFNNFRITRKITIE